jgi:hypothetical protein
VYTLITRISISSMPSFVRACQFMSRGIFQKGFQREIKVIKIAYSRLQGCCSVKIAFSKWRGLMTCRAGNKNSATTGQRGGKRDGWECILLSSRAGGGHDLHDPHRPSSPSPPPRFTVAYFPGSGMYVEHPRTSDIASYTTTPVGQVVYSALLGDLDSTRLLRRPR